jgi:dipeptidyl aminopeptidase/acylaminoacyl peptidase
VYQVGVRADGGPEGSPVRLTNGLGAHSISLSGDGKRLAYSVWTIRSNIWRAPIPATGSGSDSAAERVTVGNQNIEGLSLSPDGRWLYFDSNRDGNQDLFRVALSGGEPEQLTTNPRDDFYPNVSPDGRFVAFHSVRENGRRAIVVIPSGGGPEQIVHAGSGEDRLATWSHDGRRIAFAVTEASPAENGTYVVERGADGTWGKPRRVFDDALGAYWLPGDSALLLVPTPYARRFGPGERVLRTVPVAGGPMVELPLAMDSMGSLWPVPLPGRAEIGIKGFTAAGLAGFWIAGPRGGAPRLAIRFDDPSRPSPRFEWASDGRMLYFTVGERESDIYVAEVATTARP